MRKTNEVNTADTNLLPFDPIVLLQDIAKRWLLILLAVLVMGVGTYIASDLTYTPVYRTTTTFVVTTRSNSSNVYSNLTSTTSLAAVFTDLLNSSILRKAILQEIGTTYFDGSISAAVVPDTNLLTMTISAADPRTAFAVAKAVIEHHEEITYQVVDGITLEVLQFPSIPVAPSNFFSAAGRMKKMMALTGVAVAVMIGMFSFSRDAIRSSKEAKAKLDCRYLGEIPHESKYKTLAARLRRQKISVLLTNPATSFHFLENARKLRRRVEQHMKDGKLLMVTSLLEDEGKSTVAVNLALAMAQKHSKVLLIDCDLRKPACRDLLEEKEVKYGLRDVLKGKVSFADALMQEKMSGLFLLLETQGARDSGDLIASRQMQELLKWARQEFDFVILDLPPMAEISDAESMMEYADASILVVRQNAALAPDVNKAVSHLNSGKAKLLGCVLNNVYSTPVFSAQSYGYGRYGKYGKYGRYGRYGHYGYHDALSSQNSEK